VAPLFGGWLILRAPADSASASRLALTTAALQATSLHSVQGPYLFLGGILLLMAIGLAVSGLPVIRIAPLSTSTASPVTSIWRHRPLVFGVIAVFLYAGAEVGIGSLLVNYLAHPSVLGASRKTAALLATVYWGGAVVGRFWGWSLLQRVRVELVLTWISAAAAVLVAVSVCTHGVLSAAAILSLGLCNALIVPIVVMLAISGLGPLTPSANSAMVAGNLGAGLIPLAFGILADHVGIHLALAPAVLCYGGVLFYAIHGCRGHLLPRKPSGSVPSSLTQLESRLP
jgi:MFS transporter, FHS family, L-fucose permease